MRITQEADYAIRIVDYLVESGNDIVVDAQTISSTQNIPLRFALKILRKLNQAGIIKSFRGVKGGYSLLKAADDISFKDVIEAIDGPIIINKCLLDGAFCNLNRAGKCKIHNELDRIQSVLSRELENVKFSDVKQK